MRAITIIDDTLIKVIDGPFDGWREYLGETSPDSFGQRPSVFTGRFVGDMFS